MPNRSINVSVRMSDDEAAALAAAEIPGATTPSEKLRALIADLARRQAARGSYASMADEVEALLAPARRALRECSSGLRSSDVLTTAFERLPELVARLAVAGERLGNGDAAEEIEADLAADVAALAAEIVHVDEMDTPRALDPERLHRALGSLHHHGIGTRDHTGTEGTKR